jgi:hypothetical protein
MPFALDDVLQAHVTDRQPSALIFRITLPFHLPRHLVLRCFMLGQLYRHLGHWRLRDFCQVPYRSSPHLINPTKSLALLQVVPENMSPHQPHHSNSKTKKMHSHDFVVIVRQECDGHSLFASPTRSTCNSM